MADPAGRRGGILSSTPPSSTTSSTSISYTTNLPSSSTNSFVGAEIPLFQDLSGNAFSSTFSTTSGAQFVDPVYASNIANSSANNCYVLSSPPAQQANHHNTQQSHPQSQQLRHHPTASHHPSYAGMDFRPSSGGPAQGGPPQGGLGQQQSQHSSYGSNHVMGNNMHGHDAPTTVTSASHVSSVIADAPILVAHLTRPQMAPMQRQFSSPPVGSSARLSQSSNGHDSPLPPAHRSKSTQNLTTDAQKRAQETAMQNASAPQPQPPTSQQQQHPFMSPNYSSPGGQMNGGVRMSSPMMTSSGGQMAISPYAQSQLMHSPQTLTPQQAGTPTTPQPTHPLLSSQASPFAQHQQPQSQQQQQQPQQGQRALQSPIHASPMNMMYASPQQQQQMQQMHMQQQHQQQMQMQHMQMSQQQMLHQQQLAMQQQQQQHQMMALHMQHQQVQQSPQAVPTSMHAPSQPRPVNAASRSSSMGAIPVNQPNFAVPRPPAPTPNHQNQQRFATNGQPVSNNFVEARETEMPPAFTYLHQTNTANPYFTQQRRPLPMAYPVGANELPLNPAEPSTFGFLPECVYYRIENDRRLLKDNQFVPPGGGGATAGGKPPPKKRAAAGGGSAKKRRTSAEEDAARFAQPFPPPLLAQNAQRIGVPSSSSGGPSPQFASPQPYEGGPPTFAHPAMRGVSAQQQQQLMAQQGQPHMGLQRQMSYPTMSTPSMHASNQMSQAAVMQQFQMRPGQLINGSGMQPSPLYEPSPSGVNGMQNGMGGAIDLQQPSTSMGMMSSPPMQLSYSTLTPQQQQMLRAQQQQQHNQFAPPVSMQGMPSSTMGPPTSTARGPPTAQPSQHQPQLQQQQQQCAGPNQSQQLQPSSNDSMYWNC